MARGVGPGDGQGVGTTVGGKKTVSCLIVIVKVESFKFPVRSSTNSVPFEGSLNFGLESGVFSPVTGTPRTVTAIEVHLSP